MDDSQDGKTEILANMKYDVVQTPLGSAARAKAQLANLDLLKALKTCKSGRIPLDSIGPELNTCIQHLCDRHAYGVILSGYYLAGIFGTASVTELLRRMYDVHDFPSFLKQAYRFDAYQGFESEIERAVAWHAERRLPDAEAWRRKFAKLREQDMLRQAAVDLQPLIQVEEELPDGSTAAPTVFQLKPMITNAPRTHAPAPEPSDDPYIISQTARRKLEYANTAHKHTLTVLKDHLERQNRTVAQSKLIDAYTILSDGPAMFEVKSITEDNERDQIRHALSQLYEYRFLHSASDATLWILFSQRLSSQWYVDYLTRDRDFRVIWVEDGKLSGPSIHLLN